MKQEMSPSHNSVLSHCFDYIEDSIASGRSYSEITNGLDIEFNDTTDATIGTLRNIFSRYMPFSLNKYIKRRLLTVAYFQNKTNRKNIKARDSFQGIQRYAYKFKDEFGLAISGDYTENQLQPPLDLDFLFEINNAFCRFSIVKDFRFTGNSIRIMLNPAETLKAFLSLKSFFLPVYMKKTYEEEKEETRIIFLEISTRRLQGDYSLPTLDEIHQLISSSKLYNLKEYHVAGDKLFVFCPKMPKNLHETFFSSCDTLLPAIKPVIPKDWLHHELANTLSIISDADTFEEISKQVGICEDDAKDMVWHFLKKGYLRYMKRNHAFC